MSESLPGPDDVVFWQQAQAADKVELFYTAAREVPGGMDRLSDALMRHTGNRRLLEYVERFRGNVQGQSEDYQRSVRLGLSVGFLYHHELALITTGVVPVIGLPAFKQVQREQDTEKGLGTFMRTRFGTGTLGGWIRQEMQRTVGELGDNLSGLTFGMAEREGLTYDYELIFALAFAVSKINKLFLINGVTPEGNPEL